jgi:hypothetical protein
MSFSTEIHTDDLRCISCKGAGLLGHTCFITFVFSTGILPVCGTIHSHMLHLKAIDIIIPVRITTY